MLATRSGPLLGFSASVLMAAKQHGNVDPVVLIALRELRRIRSVEETGCKQHGAVLAVGHVYRVVCVPCHELRDLCVVGVIPLDQPLRRRRGAADGQSSTLGIEVGLVRGEPEIEADAGVIGVGVYRGSTLQTL